MASPFAVFRRNQRLMLAVVGVLAMIAFVFLGPLTQYSGHDAGPANAVAVETSFGPIRDSELKQVVQTRKLVDDFLRQVAVANVQTYVTAGMDQRILQSEAMRTYQRLRQSLMQRRETGQEHEALETILLAKKAEQMNVVVTNAAINDYLKTIVEPAVVPMLPEIIRGLGRQHAEVTELQLFTALRTELLASKVIEIFADGVFIFPPAERWEAYTRLNRRATVEVMPLVVDKFLDTKAEPTDAEVQSLFERYKSQVQLPGSPEPGFAEPAKADFEFFKIDFAKLVEEAKVSDEDVKKYYDLYKDRFFRHRELSKEPGGDASEPAKEDAEKPAEDSAEDAKDAKKPAEEKAEKAPAEKASEEKPAAESPASDTKPAAEKPAADAKPAGDAKPASGDEKKGSSLRRPARAKMLLTSGPKQPAKESAADDADKSSDAAEKQPSADAPAPVAEKPATEKSTTQKPDADQPADEDAKKSQESKDGAEKTAGDKQQNEKSGEAEPPKYDSFEKVKDSIRTALAEDQASQRVREIASKLTSEMRKAVGLAKSAKPGAGEANSAPQLDFAALAKETGATAAQTGLLSAEELSNTEIGKSYEDVESGATGARSRRYFIDSAFGREKYQTTVTTDNDRNRFISWKTDQVDERVPTLDEVKKKVVSTWRVERARDAARKQAAEDVKEAQAAKGSLEEVFGKQEGAKVAKLEPFTWLTMGSAPTDPGAGMPRLSEVPGVEDAGVDFMRTVFSLSPGEVGYAMDQSQKTVYVIRLVDYDPATDQLRKDFVREPFGKYWLAARGERSDEFKTWLDRLQKEAKVHFVRQLDRQSDRFE